MAAVSNNSRTWSGVIAVLAVVEVPAVDVAAVDVAAVEVAVAIDVELEVELTSPR